GCSWAEPDCLPPGCDGDCALGGGLCPCRGGSVSRFGVDCHGGGLALRCGRSVCGQRGACSPSAGHCGRREFVSWWLPTPCLPTGPGGASSSVGHCGSLPAAPGQGPGGSPGSSLGQLCCLWSFTNEPPPA